MLLNYVECLELLQLFHSVVQPAERCPAASLPLLGKQDSSFIPAACRLVSKSIMALSLLQFGEFWALGL